MSARRTSAAGSRRLAALWAATLLAPILTGVVVAATSGEEATAQRRSAVAERGAAVMRFDLARTTHRFDDEPGGGTETVTARDPADAAQTALIRAHLASEAGRFARGDFSDPAAIHGESMPGLATLRSAGTALRVEYHEVRDGAALHFASADAAIVGAIHAWFAAQRSDHGAHGHAHALQPP
ncbi:MAG: aspartate carbamoyltransferase [Proteobacteria bacterium]|nr:aspartate carbamoyltransferase [Pseudomonadota bacterium]